MTDYDLLPVGSALDGVRLYGDSMQPIRRGQEHPVESHSVIAGGPPGVDPDGLEPGQVQLAGTWLGSDANALADRLRAILDDPDVTEVEIDSVGTTTELDGTYQLAVTDTDTLDRVTPSSDAAWQYRLTLIEK